MERLELYEYGSKVSCLYSLMRRLQDAGLARSEYFTERGVKGRFKEYRITNHGMALIELNARFYKSVITLTEQKFRVV